MLRSSGARASRDDEFLQNSTVRRKSHMLSGRVEIRYVENLIHLE